MTTPPAEGRSATTVDTDGRRLRGERNKRAVVDALLALYEQGEVQPSAARVAELAGVSERSVFRYFDDMEYLAATAIAVRYEQVRKFFLGLDTSGSFDERLAAIIDHRVRLYDRISPVARGSLVAATRSTTVARVIETRRAILRQQAIEQFEVELAGLVDRKVAERAIDLALSLDGIDYLLASANCPRSELRASIARTIRDALDVTD
ncbi:MAG: TetR/AcrR family transcriptional regulator [Ilumatobacteraceae bacterium]